MSYLCDRQRHLLCDMSGSLAWMKLLSPYTMVSQLASSFVQGLLCVGSWFGAVHTRKYQHYFKVTPKSGFNLNVVLKCKFQWLLHPEGCKNFSWYLTHQPKRRAVGAVPRPQIIGWSHPPFPTLNTEWEELGTTFSLVWPGRGSNPQPTKLNTRTLYYKTTEMVIILWTYRVSPPADEPHWQQHGNTPVMCVLRVRAHTHTARVCFDMSPGTTYCSNSWNSSFFLFFLYTLRL